jgi:hypothetical protein
MDVFLDNDVFNAPGNTLAEILVAAKKTVDPRGRLIVEVRLDGRTLEESEMHRIAHQPLEGDELQVITANPRELSIAILHGVAGALHDARQEQRLAAEAFAADDTSTALSHVKNALTVWQQAQQAVQQSAQLLKLPLDKLSVDGKTVPQIIDDLVNRLSTVRQQLMSSDWVGLSDSMAYELDTAAEIWSGMLQMFREHVETLG